MKEVDIRQKAKNSLILWTTMSILGVIALPIMIVALVNGNWFVAVPCIAIVGFDFYGLPIGWVGFAALNYKKNVVLAITQDKITDIAELAAAFGIKEKHMQKLVNDLISKRYLAGYKLDSQRAQLVAVEKKHKRLCGSCGAPLDSENKKCAYCGVLV